MPCLPTYITVRSCALRAECWLRRQANRSPVREISNLGDDVSQRSCQDQNPGLFTGSINSPVGLDLDLI